MKKIKATCSPFPQSTWLPPPPTQTLPGRGCFHLSFNNRLVSYCNGPGADAVHIMSRTPVAAYAWSVQYRRPPSPPPATPVEGPGAGGEAPAAAPRTSPRPARPELRPGGAERARGGLENANLRDMWALPRQLLLLCPFPDAHPRPNSWFRIAAVQSG